MFREDYKKINDKLQLDDEFVKQLEKNMKQQKREVENTTQNYVFSETTCNNTSDNNPFIHAKDKVEQRYIIGARKKQNCIISAVSVIACVGIVITIGGFIFSNRQGNTAATNETEQVEDIVIKEPETVIGWKDVSKDETNSFSSKAAKESSEQENQRIGYPGYDSELIDNIDKKISAEEYTKEVAEITELEDKTLLQKTIFSILNRENRDNKNSSIVLDYAKGNRVIFHGRNYLMVYDLKKKEIQRAIWLPSSIPASSWDVQVNEEGNKIKMKNMLLSNSICYTYDIETDRLSEEDWSKVDWNTFFFDTDNIFHNIEYVAEYTGGILNPECSSNQVINLTRDISCRLTFIAPEWDKEASLAIFLYDETLEVGYIYPVFGQEGIELMKKEGYSEVIYDGQFFNYSENKIDYICYSSDILLIKENGIIYNLTDEFKEKADVAYNMAENNFEKQDVNYDKKDTKEIGDLDINNIEENATKGKLDKEQSKSTSNNVDNKVGDKVDGKEESTATQENKSEAETIDSDEININQQDDTNFAFLDDTEQKKEEGETKNETKIDNMEIEGDGTEKEMEIRLQDQPYIEINPMSLEQFCYITSSTEIHVYWEIDAPYQTNIYLYNEEGKKVAMELVEAHTPVQVRFTNLEEEQTYFIGIRETEELEQKLKEKFQEINILISEQKIELE